MGNKQNQINNANSFRVHDWVEQPQSKKVKSEYGNFKTFRQIYTNQKINQHEIVFHDEQEYHSYLDSFYWRNRQDNIVKTLYIKEKHQTDFCSTTYIADVYIQQIPIRLSDVTDIPYPENLYVLEASLDGYEKLFNSLRYFIVDENQICVDNDGYVRVWCNADLSKNYPFNGKSKEFYDQTLMVNQIISMISENTDHDLQPMSFLKYLAQRNKTHPTFQEAKTLLHDYSIEYNTPIPRCFESILDMFSQKDQNQEQQGHLQYGYTEAPKISNSLVHKVTQHFNGQHELSHQNQEIGHHQHIRNNLPKNESQLVNTNYVYASKTIPYNIQHQNLNVYNSQTKIQPNLVSQASQYPKQGQPLSEAFSFTPQPLNRPQERQCSISIERPRAFSHQQRYHFQNFLINNTRTPFQYSVHQHMPGFIANNSVMTPVKILPQKFGLLNTNTKTHHQKINGLVRSASANKINFSYAGNSHSHVQNTNQSQKWGLNRNSSHKVIHIKANTKEKELNQNFSKFPRVTQRQNSHIQMVQIQNPRDQRNSEINVIERKSTAEGYQTFGVQREPFQQRDIEISQYAMKGNYELISHANAANQNFENFPQTGEINRKPKGFQYCYYTSTTEEEIDPQIIADLLRYEQAGNV